MPRADQIDLMVGLRDLSKRLRSGKISQKFGLRITVPQGAIFDTSERTIMQPLGDKIAEVIGANLLKGDRPDGRPMPAVTGATLARRRKEAEQGERDGQAHPRYRDSKFRARVARNYARDYRSRLGKFTPKFGAKRGVVSKLLASSFKARPVSGGDGFIIFVAGNRGRPRPGERLSALETTYAGIRTWSDVAMQQPEIRKMMESSLRSLVERRNRMLFSLTGQTVRNIDRLRQESEDLGET